MSGKARWEAVKNLLKIITTTALVMMIAKAIKKDSIELDLTSVNFGRIKLGNTRIDLTGGKGSIVILAARLIKNSTKVATTGLISEYGTGFGQRSRFDVLTNFLTGKLTPPMRVVFDLLKGENYKGDPITLTGELYSTGTPISLQNFINLKDDNSANAILGAILDVFGVSASTYVSGENWETNTSKRMLIFKAGVGPEKFKEFNKLYNIKFQEKVKELQNSSIFQKLSTEDKEKILTKVKEQIKTDIFNGILKLK
jgi:hypothetical protein